MRNALATTAPPHAAKAGGARAAGVALALLSAAPSAAVEVPSLRDQETIKAVFMASSADRFCPSLRQSVPRIGAFLRARGLAGDDITGRYAAWAEGFATVLSRRLLDAPKRTCDDIDGMLGRDGEFPGLVERR